MEGVETPSRRGAVVVPLLTGRSTSHKRALRRHLDQLGFKSAQDGKLTPPERSKDAFRQLHRAQLHERLESERSFIARQWPPLKDCFANGNQIVPSDTAPRLELIHGSTWQSDLLRLAARTLEQWEQGRREPSGAAKTLIRVAKLHPDVLREVAA